MIYDHIPTVGSLSDIVEWKDYFVHILKRNIFHNMGNIKKSFEITLFIINILLFIS